MCIEMHNKWKHLWRLFPVFVLKQSTRNQHINHTWIWNDKRDKGWCLLNTKKVSNYSIKPPPPRPNRYVDKWHEERYKLIYEYICVYIYIYVSNISLYTFNVYIYINLYAYVYLLNYILYNLHFTIICIYDASNYMCTFLP